MNLPESFQDQMKQLLKEEYEQYIQSFEQTRVYGLRVNTSKISTEKFEQICPFSVHKNTSGPIVDRPEVSYTVFWIKEFNPPS